MSVEQLTTALAAAKAAHKANKADKALKSAYKAAKKALEAGKVAAAKAAEEAAAKKRKAPASDSDSDSDSSSSDDAPAAKKQKVVTKEDLEAAAKTAKAAYKANKADKSLKAAYKAAKQAAEDFKPAEAAAAAPAEEAAPVDDLLSSLKKKPAAAAAAAPAGEDDDRANPKLFVGNLSWDIDDDKCKEFFADCGGEIIDIYWLTDKESGRFKGCGFITFDNLDSAKKAYAKKGQDLMGRDITIDYAKARPDNGFKKASKSPFAGKGLSARPDNCTTTFCGNLSFDIDDDSMRKFAEAAGEIKAIRWLTDRDSGDFKGCGFVEFYDAESVDKFVLKNGESLMGRDIRIDYSKPRDR